MVKAIHAKGAAAGYPGIQAGWCECTAPPSPHTHTPQPLPVSEPVTQSGDTPLGTVVGSEP